MSAKVLSLYYHRSKLGAACYDQETATVFLLNDLSEDFDFRMVHSLLRQEEPSVVIVSKTQDVSLLTQLNKFCSAEESTITGEESSKSKEHQTFVNCENDEQERVNDENKDEDDDDGTQRIIALHLMPSIAYNFEDAKKRLVPLFESFDATKEENNLRLAFRLDLTATNMICSFGALLKYLDAVRLGVEFEDISTKTPIVSIRTITVEEMVEIDDNSRRALQIFQDELHPSAFKAYSAGGAREGISLFRMCDRCRSKPGGALLRLWFEWPTTNRETLKNRAAAVSYFVQDCNLDALDFIRVRMKKICTLKGILKRAKSQRLTLNDWRNLYTTCSTALQIAEYIRMREIKLTLIENDLNSISEDIARVTAVMYEIINFSESFAENRFVVNPNVDENLDRLKELYAALPEALNRVARAEAVALSLPASVGYVPMFGYLLIVPKDTVFPPAMRSEIELLYETDDSLHVKNERMRQLDRDIGDVKMEINDIETSAMLRLKQLICRYDKSICQAVHVCAVLDCIISLSLTAREYDWHCPRYVDEAVIDVDDGRHPIAELLSSNKFVANPIRSGGAQTKVKILMGPNASGKSVYLKQVGIIVFLAHIGSFVPAKSAIIGPVNRIITRIRGVDCVIDGMSSFAEDLSQMAVALRRGTGNSLLLIDEFGKGTVMETGFALLKSSLNYWIRKGKDDCPHVFAVSHFYSLIDHIIKDTNILSFLTMESILDNGKFEFQYELVDGYIDSSFATNIASKMGISNEVVKRADEVYDCLKRGALIDPADDDEELLYKIAPLLADLKDYDFADNLKDFLPKMSALLLPLEEENANATVCNGDVSVSGSIEMENDVQEKTGLAGNSNQASSYSESTVSKILHGLEDPELSSIDLPEETADSTSKTYDSLLNATKSSIIKKKQFDLSKSPRNVSFASPLTDLQNSRLIPTEDPNVSQAVAFKKVRTSM